MFLMALVLAAFLGLIPAAIAQAKGRSFGAWWLYGFLLWIVATPHALLAGPAGGGRKCPHCAELVKAEAVMCKHCGRDLPAATSARRAPTFEPAEDYL